jgi:hypothetical protein
MAEIVSSPFFGAKKEPLLTKRFLSELKSGP